jgi:Mg2+ and Co2+ transporter CorA
MYRGKIYKTNNAQGKTLIQLCYGDTTKLSTEQKRIEKELEAFRKNIFGDPEKKDSLDSIAKMDVKAAKTKTKAKSSSASASSSRRTKTSKPKSSTSSSSSGSARVTVRRQRH